MQKTILITGATDGIGLETAKLLASKGHQVLLHGRNPKKLEAAVAALATTQAVDTFTADLSRMPEVESLAGAVIQKHPRLDVLINNAGIFGTPDPTTEDGLDVRFAVNTIAPYLLTQRLLPSMDRSGRVVNLSSAAQAPVDVQALAGRVRLSDNAAYAQSKLALTMWSRSMGRALNENGPVVVAVNPGSLLGSKMVKQAYGIPGGDLLIGAEILVRAALDDEFRSASGQYFDNDSGRFAPPHPHALDERKSQAVIDGIEAVLTGLVR